jgi:hypothetical protein
MPIRVCARFRFRDLKNVGTCHSSGSLDSIQNPGGYAVSSAPTSVTLYIARRTGFVNLPLRHLRPVARSTSGQQQFARDIGMRELGSTPVGGKKANSRKTPRPQWSPKLTALLCRMGTSFTTHAFLFEERRLGA